MAHNQGGFFHIVRLRHNSGTKFGMLVENYFFVGRQGCGFSHDFVRHTDFADVVKESRQINLVSFLVADAGMNDLIRPTLYEAWHDIVPVIPRSGSTRDWEIVGPVCESGDWLGRDRALAMPKLIIPSLQVNMRAGRFPPAESNGVRYLRIPVKMREGPAAVPTR